jgi:hypothetical protein
VVCACRIIAFWRGHHNHIAILAFNLLLGWLVIGWILALVWSLTEVSPRQQVHVHYHQSPPP